MKKNGFTLIEMLGVIVILSILSLITIPIIDSSLNQGKKKLSDVQEEQLKKALKNYYAENIDEFNSVSESSPSCKSVQELKENGYLPTELKDPKTNTQLDDDIQVCVSKVKTCYNDGYNDVCSYKASYSVGNS